MAQGSLIGHLHPPIRMSAIGKCVRLCTQRIAFGILGLPLGGSLREKEFWEPVLDRCKKRLAIWKANYLYFGGRMTLIKTTLSNFPIHYLSLFKLLQGCDRKLKDFKLNSYGGASGIKTTLENSCSRKETWRFGFGRDSEKEYSSYGEMAMRVSVGTTISVSYHYSEQIQACFQLLGRRSLSFILKQ